MVTIEYNGTRTEHEEITLQDPIAEDETNGFGLLLGDQIGHPQPVQWIMVAREFEIPRKHKVGKKNTIDFLFIDNEALITFVECKRKQDSRDVKTWMGQLVAYLSDAYFYLNEQEMEASFRARHKGVGPDAIRALMTRAGVDTESIDHFRSGILKLNEGYARLILVTDEETPELQSYLGYLNLSMPNIDVHVIRLDGAKERIEDENHVPNPVMVQCFCKERVSRETLFLDDKGKRPGRGSVPVGRLSHEDFIENTKRTLGEQKQKILLDFVNLLIEKGFTLDGYNSGANGSKVWFNYFKILEDGTLTVIEDRFGKDEEKRRKVRAIIERFGGVTNLDERRSKFPVLGMNQWERQTERLACALAEML